MGTYVTSGGPHDFRYSRTRGPRLGTTRFFGRGPCGGPLISGGPTRFPPGLNYFRGPRSPRGAAISAGPTHPGGAPTAEPRWGSRDFLRAGPRPVGPTPAGPRGALRGPRFGSTRDFIAHAIFAGGPRAGRGRPTGWTHADRRGPTRLNNDGSPRFSHGGPTQIATTRCAPRR